MKRCLLVCLSLWASMGAVRAEESVFLEADRLAVVKRGEARIHFECPKAQRYWLSIVLPRDAETVDGQFVLTQEGEGAGLSMKGFFRLDRLDAVSGPMDRGLREYLIGHEVLDGTAVSQYFPFEAGQAYAIDVSLVEPETVEIWLWRLNPSAESEEDADPMAAE